MRRPSISSLLTRTMAALAVAAVAGFTAAPPVAADSPPTMLMDINPTGDSNPTDLTQVGNTLFFAADDGVHGTELWKTDGTAAGTVLVKDIRAGARGSDPAELTNVTGTLFFVATDRAHGRELWRSDGTAAGTVLVKNIARRRQSSLPHELVAVGNHLFFIAQRVGAAPEVWVSDGTAADTRSVYKPTSTSHFPAWGVAAGNRFYFVTWLGTDNAAQLWWTDATTTKQVKAISGIDVGFDWNGGRAMAAAGKKLYLAVDDALWVTDGTSRGTRKLLAADFAYGPALMHALGKRLIFLSGVNSKELWVSNGTAAGTQQIYNIGEAGLSGASMVTAAGQVFIARGWEYGGTLWRTNGTNAGTEPVGPGDYPALPTMLTSVGDELCFAAPDWNTFQWALWETDGSWYPPATYSVASFLLPWEGVAPAAELNGALIFNGDDGVSGAELWSYTP